MKFPTFKKNASHNATEHKAANVTNTTEPLMAKLRKHLSFRSEHLPDTVRIPAMGPSRPDEVIRSLPDATIDDLAFAIQGTEDECGEIIRRSGALKELYEAARKRGALGTTTVAEAFAAVSDEELRK